MEINGRKTQDKIFGELAEDIETLWKRQHVRPCLGILLVGERKDSQTYVRMKKKACEKLNIRINEINLPADTSEKNILQNIEKFNNNKHIHGVLIQLPLPSHVDEHKVINSLSCDKDIEGMTDINMGKMLRKENGFYNCTPIGCIKLLEEI